MKIQAQNYKNTDIYKKATPEIKEEIKAYKEKYNLNNDYLYYALRLYDLKHIDPLIVRKASSGAQLALILTAISFIAVSANKVDKIILFINAILFLAFLIIYLGGFSNQFQNEKRALRKLLKKEKVKEEFITKAELKTKNDEEDD